MPSPFPGMNPYLERPSVWRGIHTYLIGAMGRSLVPQLPAGYEVRPEEEMFIREASADERRHLMGWSDLGIAGKSDRPAPVGAGTALADAPAYAALPQAVLSETSRWLEITDSEGGGLVTVIELLSPTNKLRHRQQYEQKRLRLLGDGVSLVEIDLLRAGRRMPLNGLPPCDYCLMVARPSERPRVGVWPLMLRDPLPVLPVPLRPPDADVHLDLPALLNDVYDAGGYAPSVYRHAPEPPLSDEDRAWAQALVPR